MHREPGPGLLESAYEECFCRELSHREIRFSRQMELPVIYKGESVDCSYRLDIVVENAVIIELKSAEALSRLHEAQLMTYMKLSRISIGLLMNLNVQVLSNGIKRIVLGARE